MRRISILMAVIMCIVTTFAAYVSVSAAEDDGRYQVVGYQCGATMPVYSDANDRSGVVVSVPSGEVVDIIYDNGNGYGRAEWNGYTGWVKLKTTKIVGECQIQAPKGGFINPKLYVIVNTEGEGLELRRCPTADSSTFGPMFDGTIVRAEAISDSWAFVYCSGRYGWAHTRYMREQGPDNSGLPRYLTVGMTGEDVKDMQEILVDEGYLDSADGSFGPMTKEKVKEYQEDHGKKNPNGEVDPETWNMLSRRTIFILPSMYTDPTQNSQHAPANVDQNNTNPASPDDNNVTSQAGENQSGANSESDNNSGSQEQHGNGIGKAGIDNYEPYNPDQGMYYTDTYDQKPVSNEVEKTQLSEGLVFASADKYADNPNIFMLLADSEGNLVVDINHNVPNVEVVNGLECVALTSLSYGFVREENMGLRMNIRVYDLGDGNVLACQNIGICAAGPNSPDGLSYFDIYNVSESTGFTKVLSARVFDKYDMFLGSYYAQTSRKYYINDGEVSEDSFLNALDEYGVGITEEIIATNELGAGKQEYNSVIADTDAPLIFALTSRSDEVPESISNIR